MRKTLIRPSEAEDAAINAAALSDQDNQPLSADQLAQFKRKPGRPAGSGKELVSLRLDVEVIEAFKADGAGWQTRINSVLREWVRHH